MSRPGHLHIGVQQLQHATRELQRMWAETRRQWNDQTARDFEAKHLESMLPALRLILAATSETEEQYRQAVHDSEDPDRPTTVL
ncbi:MAG: hypothetical protein KDA92_19300 [Planctomycetales bacterium]|nr:hypothetical protein [Planctomycetales bacterium]MCA9171281.1 hypothetical protein [Planctomycetales bacterium]